MLLTFTNVDIIASVTHCQACRALCILLGDLNTTVNFTVLSHDRNMSFNCFLTCKDNFPKNSKDIITSFFSDDGFRW